MTRPLAVLRFPRGSAQATWTYGVTTVDGAAVMSLAVTQRGKQVDVTAPGGSPLGRVVKTSGRQWLLLEPGTGRAVAEADAGRGVSVSIGAGPVARARGRGDVWDLVWAQTTLLAVRKTPRKEAKRCLDVYVTDAACTPAVVAFAVHVRRWWAAAEAANQLAMQQFQAG